MKNLKIKLLTVFMAMVLVLGVVPFTALAKETSKVEIVLNGTALVQNSEIGFAEIVDGRTFVPLRLVVESLGFTADWESEDPKVITMEGQGKTIYHLLGTLEATSTHPLAPNATVAAKTDVKSYIDKKTGRTMVGLRLISEAFGVEVKWVSASRTVEINTNFKTPTLDREYTTAEDFYDIVSRNDDGTLTVKTDAGNLVRIFLSNESPYDSNGQHIGIASDITKKQNGFEGVHNFNVMLVSATYGGKYVTDESKLPEGITYWNHTEQSRIDGTVGGIVSVNRPDGSYLGKFMLSDYGKAVYILDAEIGEYKVTLLEAPYDFKIIGLGNEYKEQDENGNYYGYANVMDNGHTYGTGFRVTSELPSEY